MSFDKPTFILFHDPIFLAIFVVGAVVLVLAQRKLAVELHPFGIYILFFVLLVIYIEIRKIYE